jgi:large subunit GTPase 1
VIVQIVDARNPLLFYCVDLESYVKEVDSNKISVILVNKSDLLSDKQRLEWYRYFKSKNVHAIFWSAALATEMDELLDEEDDEDDKSGRNRTDSHQSDWTEEDSHAELDEEEELSDLQEEDEDDETLEVNKFKFLSDEKCDSEESEEESESAETSEDSEDENDDESGIEQPEQELITIKEEIKNTKEKLSNLNINEISDKNKEEEKIEPLNMTEDEKENSKILNRQELISFLKTVHKSVDKAKPGLNTIGLVGYPNVGKSSTINALLRDKKTAVSDTPGKTKHYQTLFVDDELLLCDCPGLVFPSFISTRGELILNGILPIDQMRDYVEPVNLISFYLL